MRSVSYPTVCLALAAAACQACAQSNTTTLTRERAKALLNQNPQFRELKQVDLTLVAPPEACFKEGFCLNEDGTLTDEGRRYFAAGPSRYWRVVRPAGIVHRIVTEVTGLTLGQDERQAEFHWMWDGLSDVVLRYAGQKDLIHSGTAVFQRYDDGWRLLETIDGRSAVSLTYSANRMPFKYDDGRLKKGAEVAGRLARERTARTSKHQLFRYQWQGWSIRMPPGPDEPTQRWNEIGATDAGFFFSRQGETKRRLVSYGDSKRPICADRGVFFEIAISEYTFAWDFEREEAEGRFSGKRSSLTEDSGKPTSILLSKLEQRNPETRNYPEPLRSACEQLLQAYDSWRAKYPEFITLQER
jgi:hypothetical protein